MKKLYDLNEKLNKLGYISKVFDSESSLMEELLLNIDKNMQIGFGGSVTARDMGLPKFLIDNGCNVCIDTENITYQEVMEKNRLADVYISSCNAITEDGVIINLDGTGNRIGGLSFGANKVFYIVGKNKIVNTIEDGIKRTRDYAAPLNARRLGKNTPCATTLRCENCSSPDRICRAYMINLMPLKNKETYVYLINKDLGL